MLLERVELIVLEDHALTSVNDRTLLSGRMCSMDMVLMGSRSYLMNGSKSLLSYGFGFVENPNAFQMCLIVV